MDVYEIFSGPWSRYLSRNARSASMLARERQPLLSPRASLDVRSLVRQPSLASRVLLRAPAAHPVQR